MIDLLIFMLLVLWMALDRTNTYLPDIAAWLRRIWNWRP